MEVQKLEAELAEIKQQKSQVEQRLQSIKEAEYTELLFILRALGNNELSEKLERELGTGAMIAGHCLDFRCVSSSHLRLCTDYKLAEEKLVSENNKLSLMIARVEMERDEAINELANQIADARFVAN